MLKSFQTTAITDIGIWGHETLSPKRILCAYTQLPEKNWEQDRWITLVSQNFLQVLCLWTLDTNIYQEFHFHCCHWGCKDKTSPQKWVRRRLCLRAGILLCCLSRKEMCTQSTPMAAPCFLPLIFRDNCAWLNIPAWLRALELCSPPRGPCIMVSASWEGRDPYC